MAYMPDVLDTYLLASLHIGKRDPTIEDKNCKNKKKLWSPAGWIIDNREYFVGNITIF